MYVAKNMKKLIAIQIFLLFLAVNTSALSMYIHYMPWFKSQGRSGSWTHWGDTIPNQWSHFTPIIGLYDSRDPDVLEYQVLEMKYAGFDGLFLDWYGINNGLPEYGTQPIFAILAKAGLKYAIVWEDRYANNQGGAAPVLSFMENNFFKTSNYLKVNNRPLLLVWQITYTTGAQWTTNMNSTTFSNKPILLTRDQALTPTAEGAYSWINAAGGTKMAIPSLDGFLGNSWMYMIPTCFPRFVDHYDVSLGTIDDQNGAMFVNLLTDCLESGADMIQVATWNDWQEGTIVEPSVEYQYRDLIVLQNMRRKYIDSKFSFVASDLFLPDSIFRQRRKFRGNTKELARVDSAATALFAGNPVLALNILQKKSSIVRTVVAHSPMTAVHSESAIYNIQGRKIRSFDAAREAQNYKNAPRSGVYIIRKSDGTSSPRFLMPPGR
jgi:hypothetical protein